MDQVVVNYLPFLDEIDAFPDQNLGQQITYRFGLDVVAEEFNIVFGSLEQKVQKLT